VTSQWHLHKVARERIVARSDEDRESFPRKRGFSKSETAKIVETVLSEEDTKPQSILCRSQINVERF
jgi:hypothetical protein